MNREETIEVNVSRNLKRVINGAPIYVKHEGKTIFFNPCCNNTKWNISYLPRVITDVEIKVFNHKRLNINFPEFKWIKLNDDNYGSLWAFSESDLKEE